MAQVSRSNAVNYWDTYIDTNGVQAITGELLNTAGRKITDSAAWYDEILKLSLSSPQNNDILIYNGASWVNSTGFTSTFLGLSDTISSYNDGRILYESSSEVVDNGALTYNSDSLIIAPSVAAPTDVGYPLIIKRATETADRETAIAFQMRNSIISYKNYATISAEIIDPGAASEDGRLVVRTFVDGSDTRIAEFGETTKIGDISGGNYTKIEDDGTLHFEGDAAVWDDLQVNLSSVKLSPAVAPDWVAYKNSYVLAFADNDRETIYFTAQLPHSYKTGSTIEFHIHVAPPSDQENTGVAWEFSYSWTNINSVIVSGATFGVTTDVGSAKDVHKILEIKTLPGTDMNISSMLLCTLSRNGGAGSDTYPDDIYLLAADFHFEKDTVGSREEYTK